MPALALPHIILHHPREGLRGVGRSSWDWTRHGSGPGAHQAGVGGLPSVCCHPTSNLSQATRPKQPVTTEGAASSAAEASATPSNCPSPARLHPPAERRQQRRVLGSEGQVAARLPHHVAAAVGHHAPQPPALVEAAAQGGRRTRGDACSQGIAGGCRRCGGARDAAVWRSYCAAGAPLSGWVERRDEKCHLGGQPASGCMHGMPGWGRSSC